MVHNPGQPSNPVTTVQNPGSSSGSPISSTTRGKPPAQVVSMISGVTSSTNKNPIIGKPVAIDPSTNTNLVVPPSSIGKPLGVQPIVKQPS